MEIGDEFPSFATLEEKINQYSEEHHVLLYKRSSRTIEAAIKGRRIKPKDNNTSQLVYYELEYACVHGGKNYVSRSKGVRSCR